MPSNNIFNPPASPVGPTSMSNKTVAKSIAGPLNPSQKIPVFHKGTDRVEKTGPAILKKGEAVLDTKEAAKYREAKGKNMSKHEVMKSVSESLAGHHEEKPKKEIEHISIKKSANGGHIITHHHTRPEHHEPEDHTTKTDDELADHVMQTMGSPNPGEPEADAGQSGIPGDTAGAAQPQPAAAAPSATPSPTGA